MISLLESLQNSALAQWVQISVLGYPVLLTLHSLGLALLVGLLIIIDLRVLGMPRMLSLAPLNKVMRVVWLAFAVNLVSGAALFLADAVKFYESRIFRFKLLSIVIGVLIGARINASVLTQVEQGYASTVVAIPANARVLAGLSILMWLFAIALGRYMAYE